MSRIYDHYQSYSWHQSHDQATVLLLLPYETLEDDVQVIIERNYIVAGVRGQVPILKGRLYGSVDVPNSMWQLEPRPSRLSARGRTTSSISTTSTQSSYAVVTEPEISSSFAASLEGGFVSDMDEPGVSSPALSSPVSSSVDENSVPLHRRHRFTTSHPVSPHAGGPSMSVSSSFSSLESLHASTGRLLTLHLEKAESVIWPSMVVGPVPNTLSPSNIAAYPWATGTLPTTESKYNMDPTSQVLIALDLSDIRQSKEEAFEYFVRAWHQAHVPSATMRLSTHYLPVNTILPEADPAAASSSSLLSSASLCSTPTLSNAFPERPVTPEPGTPSYYMHYLGGSANLAQLYLEAGLLYLEGTATSLLSSSYSGLSALRMSGVGFPHTDASSTTSGTETWRRDRDTARRYFERARKLDPLLDVPLLPPSPDSEPTSEPESNGRRRSRASRASPGVDSGEEKHFQMPTIDVPRPDDGSKEVRRRRRKDEVLSGNASSNSLVDDKVKSDDDDNTWYLYLPGLVGAGTALLVVGFLSFSSWRKGQGS